MERFEMTYTVLGGLGLFFLGMKYLSESLQAIGSDFIRKVINWLTTNRVLAVIVGTLVTCIVQSSSITTVMVVGMVNAGLMNLTQALGVIFGANIGTTITGWIIAIKVGKYGLLFVALGIFPMFFTKNDNWRALGKLTVALGLVFYGLDIMSHGLKPLRTDKDFLSLLHFFTADSYPSLIGCIMIGTITTAIVQSSSAMLGIVIAMASTGVISFQTAMGLVLGLNIGTTITAILASIGANTNAKRAARAHAFFNIFGALLISSFFWKYIELIDIFVPYDPNFLDSSGAKPYITTHIAMGHTIFNVIVTFIFTIFIKQLATFVTFITPSHEKERTRLKPFLATTMAPALGLEQGDKEIEKMMTDLKTMIEKTYKYLQLEKDNPELLDDILATENHFDIEQKELTVYMTTVMESNLTPEQSSLGYALIRSSDEIESVSDYCASLVKIYKKTMVDKDHALNADAKAEFNKLFEETIEYYGNVRKFYHDRNPDMFEELEVRSHQIKKHADQVIKNHLERIKEGKCSAFSGLSFSDMVRITRRIRGHSLNIVECISSSLREFKQTA